MRLLQAIAKSGMMFSKKEPASVLFIVSTGRTGTVFLANYLRSAFPNCKAIHERNAYIFRFLSNMRVHGRINDSVPKAFISTLRRDLLRPGDSGFYIESNPLLFGVVDILAELVPHSRFVHVVRDPRDYVFSCMNWGSFRGKRGLFNQFMPYWSLRTIQEDWNSYYKEEIVSHWWIWVNGSIQRGLLNVPEGRKIALRFEDIVYDETHEGLRRLQAFIGLTGEINGGVMKKMPRNPSKDYVFPRWQEWDKQRCQMVNKICCDLMAHYGYGKEPLWIDKLRTDIG